MKSRRKSQAQGKHARDEPGDPEATCVFWFRVAGAVRTSCTGAIDLARAPIPRRPANVSPLGRVLLVASSGVEVFAFCAPMGGQVGLPFRERLPAQEISLQARLVGPKTIDQAMIEDTMMQKKTRHEHAGRPLWARSALSHCRERGILRPVLSSKRDLYR